MMVMQESKKTEWNKVEIRLDGDLRKPRIAKCTNEQEIMDLMASVRWEHIRMGIAEAALSKKDSLVPALAYQIVRRCCFGSIQFLHYRD